MCENQSTCASGTISVQANGSVSSFQSYIVPGALRMLEKNITVKDKKAILRVHMKWPFKKSTKSSKVESNSGVIIINIGNSKPNHQTAKLKCYTVYQSPPQKKPEPRDTHFWNQQLIPHLIVWLLKDHVTVI